MSKQFDRPIPGQSLTSIPKNAPYENPPEITDPEEALDVHLIRLTEPEKMGAALDILESGVDLQTLVEGLLRSAVINGIHSLDVSLLIAPVIHEYIKLTADEVGIEYEEGFEDKSGRKEKAMYAVATERARKKLEQMDMMPKEEDKTNNLEEVPEDMSEEMAMEEPKMKPKGLMARGDM